MAAAITSGQRQILFLSAGVNALGTLFFLPPFRLARDLFGLPWADDFYLWLVASWIVIFGLGYLAMALTRRLNHGILVVGAGAKISFALLVLGYVLSGRWSIQASLLAVTDFVLAVIYLRWVQAA